jgi:hypothetical protein
MDSQFFAMGFDQISKGLVISTPCEIEQVRITQDYLLISPFSSRSMRILPEPSIRWDHKNSNPLPSYVDNGKIIAGFEEYAFFFNFASHTIPFL